MQLKKLFLYIITSVNSILLQAQIGPDIQWSKIKGLGRLYQMDVAYSTEPSTDGGYIMAGFVGAVVAGDRNCWIVKIDSTGNTQWEKELGGSENDECYSVAQTTDGGFIVAGVTNSSDADLIGMNAMNHDYWIIKLTGAGSIEWQKVLGGSSAEYAKEIQQTKDGGYIVAGWSASTDGDVTGNHGSVDYWIVKLTSAGSIEWQKSLGGSKDDWGTAVQQSMDGGYIVAGYSASKDGDITFNHGDMDYWVVKLNSIGSVEWQKSFGGSGLDRPWSIQQTSDKGFIVAGESKSHDGDLTSNYGDYDWWVVKMDQQGNMQWQKNLGGSLEDAQPSVIETRDSMFVIAGVSYSGDVDVTVNHGSGDYWVVELNQQGSIQWEKCYGGTYGEQAYSIRQTMDGGFILGGMASSQDGDVNIGDSHLWPEFWVVKIGASKISFDLLNFTAIKNCGAADLHWQTSSETGTSSFGIQRSSNGIDFETIGSVTAAGNSTTIKYYQFTDPAALDGQNYYRLKLLSVNSRYKYSLVQNVRINKKGWGILSPNPANNIITILPTCNLLRVDIIAADGKLIRSMQPSLNDQYNIADLPSATYLLRLQYENSIEALRLVKQ